LPSEDPLVFTPDNEPYLGRQLLFHFDQIITSAMEANANLAPLSFHDPSNRQIMAGQVIAQSLSIVLSIRELIRQGYLFGAHVLKRPLVERVTILLFIDHYPDEIAQWNAGWMYRDAPSLALMLKRIQEKQGRNPIIPGHVLTEAMNSLVHGRPDSAPWNMVPLKNGVGHAVSKILNRPDLCDELCADVIPWAGVLLGMMAAYFPNRKVM
jgi:hypothetical protein